MRPVNNEEPGQISCIPQHPHRHRVLKQRLGTSFKTHRRHQVVRDKTSRWSAQDGLAQERRYAPYAKWLGVAFARLDSARELGTALDEVATAPDYAAREGALVLVYEAVARRHNALGVTAPLEPMTGAFQVHINDAVRPFRVLNAERFGEACRDAIGDERLRRLALAGAIDQLTDPTDFLANFSGWPRRIGALYREDLGAGSPAG